MQATAAQDRSSEVVVKTTMGSVRGRSEHGAQVFKAIPYAAATAGANRFLPPQPQRPWAGVRDAFEFGRSAPQGPVVPELLRAYGAIEAIGEDCLHLNVFTPEASRAARKPVMVWLHGGGWWAFAGTSPALHAGALAVRGDVVVVTLNHRLNLFGHLQLDDTDPRFADSGNVGALDVVAALRWVRDNIAAFGGDPGNITLFGHSGGGSKVIALMTTPLAQGLFHKAIAQSCSGSLRFTSREEAAAMSHALAAQLGLRRLTGAALQALPLARLVAALVAAPQPYRPILDGRTFTRHPFDPDATPLDIPFMTGVTATETRLTMASNVANFKLDAAEVQRRAARFLQVDPIEAGRIIDAYRADDPPASPSDLLGAVTSDYAYVRNTRRGAQLQAAAARAPVFSYLFNWRTPACDGLLRSPHTLEVPFIFGTAHAAVDVVGSSADHAALTQMMIATWSAFAHRGDPNNATLPHWPRFEARQRATMVLDVQGRVDSDPGATARAALDALPYFEYSMPMNFGTPADQPR